MKSSLQIQSQIITRIEKNRIFKLLIFCLLFPTLLIGQGLNCEFTLNNNYTQSPSAVHCVDEFTYLVKDQKYAGSFFNAQHLYKVDTNGLILWTANIAPIGAEFIWVNQIESYKDGGIILLGGGHLACDVLHDCFQYIQRYSAQGVLLWSKIYWDESCMSIMGTSSFNHRNPLLKVMPQNDIWFTFLEENSNQILILDSLGTTTDSFSIGKRYFIDLQPLGGFDIIAYDKDTLWGWNVGGASITKLFNQDIIDIESFADTLFVITSDSIFLFDNNLSLISQGQLNGYSNYSNFHIDNNSWKLMSNSSQSSSILQFNDQYIITDSISFLIDIGPEARMDYSDDHVSYAIPFHYLLSYTEVRFLDYSLKDTTNHQVLRTNIGVVDMEQYDEIAIQQTQTDSNLYRVNVDVDVLVKNYGPYPLYSCRLSSKIYTSMIAGDGVNTKQFSNLYVLPGDSVWLNMGWLGTKEFLTANGSPVIMKEWCVYSSTPNFVSDLIVSDDKFCKYFTCGYVGTDEHSSFCTKVYPNPSNDRVFIDDLSNSIISMEVFDIYGRLIRKETSKFNFIDFQEAGIFILRINYLEKSETRRIIISN